MADKGFNISDLFVGKGTKLVIYIPITMKDLLDIFYIYIYYYFCHLLCHYKFSSTSSTFVNKIFSKWKIGLRCRLYNIS